MPIAPKTSGERLKREAKARGTGGQREDRRAREGFGGGSATTTARHEIDSTDTNTSASFIPHKTVKYVYNS